MSTFDPANPTWPEESDNEDAHQECDYSCWREESGDDDVRRDDLIADEQEWPQASAATSTEQHRECSAAADELELSEHQLTFVHASKFNELVLLLQRVVEVKVLYEGDKSEFDALIQQGCKFATKHRNVRFTLSVFLAKYEELILLIEKIRQFVVARS